MIINLPANVYLQLDARSVDKIKSLLLKEAVNNILHALRKNKNQILKELKYISRKNLLNSPEVKGLMDENGKLRAELGIEYSSSTIDGIIDFITNSIDVDISKNINKGFDLNVEISFTNKKQIEEIYNQSFSYYETEKGVKIEWLKWLLEAGNKDVIFGYRIRYGVDLGRTGDAVMIKSKKANWRVPPEFSGTEDNNFITRSLSTLDHEMSTYIEQIIQI